MLAIKSRCHDNSRRNSHGAHTSRCCWTPFGTKAALALRINEVLQYRYHFFYLYRTRPFFPFPLGRRRRARYIPSANKCSSGCLCRSSMFAISLRISDRWFVRGLGVNKEFCLVPLRGPAYYDTSRYACFISPIGCAVTVDFSWFLRTRAAFGKSSFLSVALARSSERSGLSYLFSGNIFW